MKRLFIALLLCLVCLPGWGQVFEPFAPVGEIKMFGGSTAPTGFLLCDGSTISSTTYPALFAVIGTTYGNGTTFKVPDFRGVFPKGMGSQSIGGVTYANASGTPQADRMQAHGHDIRHDNTNYVTTVSVTAGAIGVLTLDAGGPSTISATTAETTTAGTPRTDTITEPANVGVNFIIKY